MSEWLNTDATFTREALRGRVVMLHALQMLCPGCVLHAVPQAERVHRTVARDDVVVIGLLDAFVVAAVNNCIATVSCVGRLHCARVGFGVSPSTSEGIASRAPGTGPGAGPGESCDVSTVVALSSPGVPAAAASVASL